MDNTSPPVDSVPIHAPSQRWTLRVVSIFLWIQALGLLAINYGYASRIAWYREWNNAMLSVDALNVLVFGALLVPVAIFEAITALGFLFVQRTAWLRAMIIQGVVLVVCLMNYVTGHDMGFLYPLMFSCIVNVLYLNTNEVRATFHTVKTEDVAP